MKMAQPRRQYPKHSGDSWLATLKTSGIIPVTLYPSPVVPFVSPTKLIPLSFAILYKGKNN